MLIDIERPASKGGSYRERPDWKKREWDFNLEYLLDFLQDTKP